jgi:hypothetical protein
MHEVYLNHRLVWTLFIDGDPATEPFDRGN